MIGKFLLDVAVSAPRIAGAIVALRLVVALQPLLVLLVGKLIVDEVVVIAGRDLAVASLRGLVEDGTLDRLLVLLAAEFMLVLVANICGRVGSVLEGLLGDVHANDVSRRVIAHTASLDLIQLESSECQNLAMRARNQSFGAPALLGQVLSLAQSGITAISLVVGVVAFVPGLIVLLALMMLPALVAETRFNARGYDLELAATQDRRQIEYLRFLGSSPDAVKEIKLLTLGPFLAARFAAVATRIYAARRQLAIKRAFWGSLLSAAGTATYYAAYGIIIWRVVTGTLSLGELVFLSGALLRINGMFETIIRGIARLDGQARSLGDLFAFFALEPQMSRAVAPRPFPSPIRTGIAFENVGFRYSGHDTWAVRGLSFSIKAGETLALVGANGAGKTTIVKLMTRLYDPDEGRITIDGIDLRALEQDELRQRIGIVFQDFVRYNLTLRENIGVGEASAMEDRERIERAATAGVADAVIGRLPLGLDQPLGRRFLGGVELSGGEWQKIATARAFMRDADLLILDEPTAALDPVAEIAAFERLKALRQDRASLLISHRFSTVRMADRIIVIADGRVIESGSHAELVALEGRYAELFEMQAAGYR